MPTTLFITSVSLMLPLLFRQGVHFPSTTHALTSPKPKPALMSTRRSGIGRSRCEIAAANGAISGCTSSQLIVGRRRSEEHTSELQSLRHLVCRLLLEKKNRRGGG